MNRLSKILQLVGVFIFAVFVLATILFAEGYQFDAKTRDLVKKSVLYFERVRTPGEVEVHLDGEPVAYSSPLELRVVPGAHEVRIESKDYVQWKKRIVVPEETVVRFSEIRLFPAGQTDFATSLNSVRLLRYHSSSERGIFFANEKLHFGKYYSFEDQSIFWVADIPFLASTLKLMPISKEFWFGITAEGKLFSYDTTLRQHFPVADFPVLDAAVYGETLFALDQKGGIWKIDRDTASPEFFFRAVGAASAFKHIEKERGRMLFLFDNVAVVTDGSGAILFQESNVKSASIDSDLLTYATDGEFVRFDLHEKKIILRKILESRVNFISRIGGTHQFFFQNDKNEIAVCDEDMENCHSFGKIDSFPIFTTSEKTRFFAIRQGELIMFDFEVSGLFPEFLQNLVSFANGKIFE